MNSLIQRAIVRSSLQKKFGESNTVPSKSETAGTDYGYLTILPSIGSSSEDEFTNRKIYSQVRRR